jgi:hypothetical protein
MYSSRKVVYNGIRETNINCLKILRKKSLNNLNLKTIKSYRNYKKIILTSKIIFLNSRKINKGSKLMDLKIT